MEVDRNNSIRSLLPPSFGKWIFSREGKIKRGQERPRQGMILREHGRVVAKSITLSTVGYSFSNQTGVLVIEREAGKSWISEISNITASRLQDSDRVTISKTVPTTGSSSVT